MHFLFTLPPPLFIVLHNGPKQYVCPPTHPRVALVVQVVVQLALQVCVPLCVRLQASVVVKLAHAAFCLWASANCAAAAITAS
mmetsp:Transcript_138835/g.241424  ORF Transcript_138835/g.241424 Transcript_138835/m.241424 type:complete len:83 (-) Transcript_138835:110-358(-)